MSKRKSKRAAATGPSYDFDAIVVGSGVSGGWAAKELTEKGLKVLLVDRGYMVEHGAYRTEGEAPWDKPHRGTVPPELVKSDYFISRFGYISEFNLHHYNNDRLNPYDYEGSKPFHWIRPAAFGGKSLIWGKWVFRWSDLDFEANKKDGHGNDWPVRYADMAPWYAHVEKFIGVAGSRENLPQLPDSEFQPPHPMNVAERWVKDRLETAYDGRRKLIHGRTTNMTEDKPEQGRTRCQYRNHCDRGCSFGAYFSTQSSTLPAAMATGNLTTLADHAVASLEYDPVAKRVVGVNMVNTQDLSRKTVRSRMVFLCASTIGSLQIMLNSRSEAFPNGIANSSGLLGKYVMDHPFRAGAWGRVPGFLDKVEYGRRPTGVYVPRFRNITGGKDEDVDFLRGYNYQGGASRWDPETPGFGVQLKQALRRPGPWGFGMGGFGECLPYKDNVVSLHPTKTDRFGIPLVRFDVTYRENERRMLLDMHKQGVAMLKAVGLEDVGGQSNVDDQTPGRGIHEMGGARMGADPKDSVLNKWSQAHDVSNLFVTDGAQFASSSCVNPSLSFMAFTARAANHAAELAKQGSI